MKHYEVFISDKADDDMEAIYKYISDTLSAPVAAAKQHDRISEAMLTLEEMPERIKIMDSEPEHSQGLRPLIVDNYTIFYVVKSDRVNIVRILYSASDISRRLSEE
jgi:plasmid stabilization system protein ParE